MPLRAGWGRNRVSPLSSCFNLVPVCFLQSRPATAAEIPSWLPALSASSSADLAAMSLLDCLCMPTRVGFSLLPEPGDDPASSSADLAALSLLDCLCMPTRVGLSLLPEPGDDPASSDTSIECAGLLPINISLRSIGLSLPWDRPGSPSNELDGFADAQEIDDNARLMYIHGPSDPAGWNPRKLAPVDLSKWLTRISIA